MTFLDASRLYEHWVYFPPEHEALAIVAMACGWRPPKRELTDVEKAEELERKYRSGQFLRPDQMAGMLGGLQQIKPGDKVAGVGPLPWAEMQVKKPETPK